MLPSPLAFVARIRRDLRDRRNFRAWQAALAGWRAAHPGGDCAQFYAWYARERLRTGRHLPQTLGSHVNQRFQRRRALAMRELLVGLGLRPGHAVLDYGCGSLWIGEALIEYLDAGRYIGLDVVEDFWRESRTGSTRRWSPPSGRTSACSTPPRTPRHRPPTSSSPPRSSCTSRRRSWAAYSAACWRGRDRAPGSWSTTISTARTGSAAPSGATAWRPSSGNSPPTAERWHRCATRRRSPATATASACSSSRRRSSTPPTPVPLAHEHPFWTRPALTDGPAGDRGDPVHHRRRAGLAWAPAELVLLLGSADRRPPAELERSAPTAIIQGL